MDLRRERSSPPGRGLFMTALALLVVLSATPFGAMAEIPHENYDLASSDLDTVIQLLNSSIRSSEGSLRALNDEDTVLAGQYLDRVSDVLKPADDILSDIQDVAGSYEDLNALLPPFTSLYESESSFLAMEAELLHARNDIVSSSELLNLSDEDMIAALDAIKRFNSLVDQMNSTIDEMLVHALAIDALTVDGTTPFVPNDLAELIEQLRDMIDKIVTDMQAIIDDGIPWDNDVSFLLIWVVDPSLYLGETIVGGGYLFVHGTFVAGHPVDISMDGGLLLQVITGTGGRYAFSKAIPLNESWLGSHTVVAHADTVNLTVDSDPVQITISLVPTSIRLTADMSVMSRDQQVTLEAKLKDVKGMPVPLMNCTLRLDGDDEAFVTDDAGSQEWSWAGSELGFGTHIASASYHGVLPYASCSSNTVKVVVDIPTNITINLFSDRLREGYYVVGNGTLTSNGSQPMAARNVSLYVDGGYVRDIKTQANGVFAFSISTDNMTTGTHTLRAAFELREDIWRYSEAEASFVIITYRFSDYPFFPWIPGWNIGLGEEIPYLFFGENAYYTWMFIILVIGIVIKALQVRKGRMARESQRVLSPDEVVGEGLEPEPHDARDWAPVQAPEWLSGANERIVWHYNHLIAFLMRRRRIGIADNMTHWEVARLLQSLGYPESTTKKVTVLFEKAYYSGTTLSEADVIQMGSSAHSLKRVGGVRPAG